MLSPPVGHRRLCCHAGLVRNDHTLCVHLDAVATGRFWPGARPRPTGPLGLVACHAPQAAGLGKSRLWDKIGLALFLGFPFFRKPLFI
jgi:hypothetical protein